MNNFNHYYDSETTRQVISVIVLNEHNVLSRIVGLFSARGYNIDSLTVAPIMESQYSRVNDLCRVWIASYKYYFK